jgi:lipopolysaccharide export system protein LptA
VHYDKVHISKIVDPAFELWCDALDAKGKGATVGTPGEAQCSGHVRIETKSGLKIETDQATYMDATGIVDMPNAVTFARGRLSGRGVGAKYSRNDETVDFFDQATAQVAAGPDGKGAVSASSKSMTLLRGKKSLLLNEGAKIVDESETLSGDTSTLYFTDDEENIKFLELRGKASAVPLANTPDAAPEMHADSITLAFQPDGRTLQHATLTTQASLVLTEKTGKKSIEASWIDVYTAPDGKTLTRLDARDKVVVNLPASGETPARTIRAATLTSVGDEKVGLKAAQFNTNVVFEEPKGGRGGAPRKGTSQSLLLTLNGSLDAIDKAEFRQNVEFTDADLTARADFAEYREAQGILNLRQVDKPGSRIPSATDPKVQVNGLAIDLNTTNHNVKASGDVRTVTKPDPQSGKKGQNGLFNDKEPVIGLSDAFDYNQESGQAVYTGSAKAQARVIQGKSEVIGDEVRVNDDTQNLDATGKVSTTFEMTVESDKPSTTAAAKPTVYHVTAATFHYDDAKRTAKYDGDLVSMTSTDGTTEGKSIILTLAAEGRALEKLHAEGRVWSQMSGGYESVGTVLDYDAPTDIYVLDGKPAKVKAPPQQKDGTSCPVTIGLKLELNRKTGAVRSLDKTGVPAGSEQTPCTQSIRPR